MSVLSFVFHGVLHFGFPHFLPVNAAHPLNNSLGLSSLLILCLSLISVFPNYFFEFVFANNSIIAQRFHLARSDPPLSVPVLFPTRLAVVLYLSGKIGYIFIFEIVSLLPYLQKKQLERDLFTKKITSCNHYYFDY